MLDQRTLRDRLGAILTEETEAANQLLSVLLEEREALTRRDLEEIREIAERKQSLIETLEELSARQNSFLKEGGIDPGNTALEASLRDMGLQAVADQWNTLRIVLKDCQKENQINGGIIEISRRFAQQVLDTLRGVTAEGRLYGPSGETQPGGAKKGPIATA